MITFTLNEYLFRRTGKTTSSRCYQLKDKFGFTPPYKCFAVGIDENFSLYGFGIETNAEPVSILKSLNQYHIF